MSEQQKHGTSQQNFQDQANDDIDLFELWLSLLKYKWKILLSMFVGIVVSASVSFQMPNIYRAEVLLAPAQYQNLQGSLASALGLDKNLLTAKSDRIDENLAVLQSRDFLWQFVQENNLMPILFENQWDAPQKRWKALDIKQQPGQMDVYRVFVERGNLKVEKEKNSSLIIVVVEWKDAVLAAEWANALTNKLNRQLARQAAVRSESNLKALYSELEKLKLAELRKATLDEIAEEQKQLRLATTQKDFAFKIIDPAVTPDKKVKPRRWVMIILSALFAGFAAIAYAFIKEAVVKRQALK